MKKFGITLNGNPIKRHQDQTVAKRDVEHRLKLNGFYYDRDFI